MFTFFFFFSLLKNNWIYVFINKNGKKKNKGVRTKVKKKKKKWDCIGKWRWSRSQSPAPTSKRSGAPSLSHGALLCSAPRPRGPLLATPAIPGAGDITSQVCLNPVYGPILTNGSQPRTEQKWGTDVISRPGQGRFWTFISWLSLSMEWHLL